MIAKALVLVCLVAAANSAILKKVIGYQTPLYAYRYQPEIHEYVAQPVVHKVVHPVHVENVVQPVVHTLYKSPVIQHSVETPVAEAQPAAIAAIPEEARLLPEGTAPATPAWITKK